MHDLKVLTQSTMGSPCWTHLGPRCHSLEPLVARCLSRGPLGKEPWTRGSPEGPSAGKPCGGGGELRKGFWRGVSLWVLGPMWRWWWVMALGGLPLRFFSDSPFLPLLQPVCACLCCVCFRAVLSLIKWKDFFQNTIHKGFKSGRVIINIRHFSIFLPF